MTRADLERLRMLTHAVQWQADRLKELRSTAERTTHILTDVNVQSNRSTDALSDIAIRLVEEQAVLERMIEDLTCAQYQAVNALFDSDLAPRTVNVMIARYIEAKDWQTIIDEMHCSRATIFRLHRAGLKALDAPTAVNDVSSDGAIGAAPEETT